ncbi:hypothetical protein HC761_00500, partial [bacterium]|nr:hypothetical protein [bacterium]
MAIIINKSVLSALWVTLSSTFSKAFSSMGEKLVWKQIAMVVKSTARENNYSWLGKFLKFRKWAGERVYQALLQSNYKIVNEKWECSIEVSRDDIEDEQLGTYMPLLEMQGQAAAEHPEELCLTLLKSGNTELCYDGQFFFDTDHPIILADGTEGVYAATALEGMPADIAKKYFEPFSEDKVRVVEEARNLISFKHLNLVATA